ncbi:MAG: AAA family ATPase [Truepera sp.]|nr:AAA family ATPase [Truepera sp.]
MAWTRLARHQFGDADIAMTEAPWDSYLETAREKYEDIDSAERYKMDLAKALASAREALLREERDWPTLVKAAITHKQNNIINWHNHPKLLEWIDGNEAEAREALSKMWSEDDRTPGDRVRAFDGILPESVFPRTAVGTRLNAASYLMMGIDPHRYPPYQKKSFRIAYQTLGYPQSSADDDVGGEYEYTLDFLDRVLEEARRRGMDRPSTRLEAQSVVWHLRDAPPRPPSTRPPRPQVRNDLNTILYGPPGTGKTWHTVTRAVAVVENREVAKVEQEDRAAVKRRFDEYRGAGRIEMVTFHQNTTYEDFVEGIRPVLDVGEVRYEMSRGVFRRITERAALDLNRRYVLVIDEINRGNIARIFGELITLIEDSKRIGQDDEARVTLPGSKTDFGVPTNLHVLGTMNTADRSIALLDTALRRRFVFVEMIPDPSHPGVGKDADGIDCEKVLDAMNRRIAVLLDREHQIGHTYFLGVDSLEALARTFRTRIMPLLQEYFYDDWEKIRAVLNDNGFVLRSDPPEELVRLDLVDANRAVYDLLPDDDDRWADPTAYRAIYERMDDGSAG